MASKQDMLAKIREFIAMMEKVEAKDGKVTLRASSLDLLCRLARKGLITLENEG